MKKPTIYLKQKGDGYWVAYTRRWFFGWKYYYIDGALSYDRQTAIIRAFRNMSGYEKVVKEDTD